MELVPPDPPLADGTILLRPPVETDVPAIAAACQDPEISRWTRVPDDYSEEDAREFVSLADRTWREGTDAPFAITDARTGDLLGAIGLHDIEWPIARVGYWVKRDARGRGVASRALALVARWSLDDLGAARLELLADPLNGASQRVAEKAGFVREGVLRAYLEIKGRRRDSVMFSLLASDFDATERAEGFEFTVRGGAVAITHRGKKAAVLRAEAAQRFLADIEAGDPQSVMARVTCNFKRGNERQARSQPRNRAGR